METKVTFSSVKKGSVVLLAKDLPLGAGFGNRMPIPAVNYSGNRRSGHVTSEGFVQGMLDVVFDLYPEGRHEVHFNELSACEFLTVDFHLV